MPQDSQFDVFLSHSSKDKAVVRPLAERLRNDGLRVWFDEWEIRRSDDRSTKIEEGLDNSRVLVLCMSANAFGSDWAQLESQTFRFRDPLNKNRRFIPLRLDHAPVENSLAQFLCINWYPNTREREYAKLLEACRSEVQPQTEDQEQLQTRLLSLGHGGGILSVAWSPDGQQALSGSYDQTVRLWELASGRCLRVFEGHSDSISSVSWGPDGQQALSGSYDQTVRLWDIASGRCLRVFEGHSDSVSSVARSPDGQQAISGSNDQTMRLWEIASGRCLRVFEGHSDSILSVAWSPNEQQALSGSYDQTMRLWDIASGRCLRVFEGHSGGVASVAWSPDGKQALAGSYDRTIRLWETSTGGCLNVFKGHWAGVASVAWSPDGQQALSGSYDHTMRLWELASESCLRVFKGHGDSVLSIAWSPDGQQALSGSGDQMRLWELTNERCLRVFEGHSDGIASVAWSSDGQQALSGSHDQTMRLWELASGRCLRVFDGHDAGVLSVALSPDGQQALSGSDDQTMRLWELISERCLRVFEGHSANIWSVAWSPDAQYALSGSSDHTMWLWELASGRCLRVFEGHSDGVLSVAWSPNAQQALSSSYDQTMRLWEISSGRCLRVFEGHSANIWSVAWSPDGQQALSGSSDHTMRLWDIASGHCLRVFEGHGDGVLRVAWSPDGQQALSGSRDHTMRLWEIASGRCLHVFKGHSANVISATWSPDGRQVLSGSWNGVMRIWETGVIPAPKEEVNQQIQYTNAKVLLVGDSGAGKTGLSNYLAHNIKIEDDKPLPSTDGAWATHWPLRHSGKKVGFDREIWLWDFAGQVDYRLVHQLFMDDTAVAVLVFNPQHENPFESLGHWDNDLVKAARKSFRKLLVAGRVDRGGLVVSADSIKNFMDEHGFLSPLHLTSAKTGDGCDALREAIVEAIDWQNIPETTSPALYQRMKQEILNLRDQNIVLIRFAELKQHMDLALRGESFKLEELNSVVSLLAGPGMIQRLDFGGFILLRPEVLSRYAAAVVRTVRQHPQELGCIREDEMLAGALDYQDFERLSREDEAVVLRALLETFVNRAWCLRQSVDDTVMLTFPSYFRRERKEQPGHPSVLVTYRFDGPTNEIYATLVVRLHHTKAFESKDLWKSAADFTTQTGATLGFTLIPETEGTSRLEVYFQPDVGENSRVIFLRYIDDHLRQHAKNVVRLRHYFCSTKNCKRFNQPYADRGIIEEALADGGSGKVYCPGCGKSIRLQDRIEEKFESLAVKEMAREMQLEGQAVIDNESRELILVGHAYSIVAEAGQIYRGYTNSDHGIDGEIEFKDDNGRATGKKLYLQLKSGDSYLKKRQRDDKEIFPIKSPRWATYWQQQAYTVMLVVRTSDGEIRWMDISTYLKRETGGGQKDVKQIEFKGERFDVMSVRRWREKALR